MHSRSDLHRVVARLVATFEPHCRDTTTLTELAILADDPGLWSRGHDLFQRIRQKTLDAGRRRDGTASAQYVFEEVCAKSLYNLSGSPAPFDADSPEWILPNALALAEELKIPDSAVRAAFSRRRAGHDI